jgi:hypothetical protein
MFVRQNCCIPLDEGPDDNVPASRSVSPPVPESPAVSEDKLKVKSRYTLKHFLHVSLGDFLRIFIVS